MIPGKRVAEEETAATLCYQLNRWMRLAATAVEGVDLVAHFERGLYRVQRVDEGSHHGIADGFHDGAVLAHGHRLQPVEMLLH